jgi:transposase
VIGGVRQKMHIFFMDLPHSDAPFMKAYPAEATEAFLDGHVSAISFFGGLPHSILPVPVAGSFEALNAKLEADCLSELDRSVGRHSDISETLGACVPAFRDL